MFGGNANGDPFGNPFDHMHRQMRQMDNLMNAMIGDAFDMLNTFGMGMPRHPMINNNNYGEQAARNRQREDMMLSPFGGFGFGGPLFGGMMNQMHNLQERALHDPESMVVSESTTISYNGGGQPKVMQSSTRKVGNVKETRKALRDGEREELSVGHSIGDRSHIIEKKRDKDGRIRQQQKFINLKEDEAPEFNEHFKTQARNNINEFAGIFGDRGNRRQQAIENNKKGPVYRNQYATSNNYHQTGETSTPIITIPDDDEDEIPISNGKTNRNRRYNYDDNVVYSNNGAGPTIQEIDDSDAAATSSNPKRRKGVFKFLG